MQQACQCPAMMSLCPNKEFDENSTSSSMSMRNKRTLRRRRTSRAPALLVMLAIHGASAFVPASSWSACNGLAASSSKLCATKEPKSNQLFEIDDDDDYKNDDANYDQVSFEDVDYDVDYDDDEFYYEPPTDSADKSTNKNLQVAASAAASNGGLMADVDSWNDYQRDEDDILTEREDRLFLTEDGTLEDKPREACILVGVEDLSAKRRAVQAARNAGRELLPEEDQTYFTLEESMTEMRELIKTSGMELVGEVTQRLNEPNPKTYVVSQFVLLRSWRSVPTHSILIGLLSKSIPGMQP